MSLVSVTDAVELLNQSRVVAIPTETVYGLAGLIDRPEAIHLIFSTKKRPSFDPLIVHVRDSIQAQQYCEDWNEVHSLLSQKFWPGPLTLVLKKNSRVSSVITSGLDTVGLRCPKHPVALDLLKRLSSPLAAPSANMFTKTSPTIAMHVETEFSSKVPVVDGGPCDVGLESTICFVESVDLKLKNCRLQILRRGAILAEHMIAELALRDWKATVEVTTTTVAPGQMEAHYQPGIPLVLIKNSHLSDGDVLKNLPKQLDQSAVHILILDPKPEIAARTLYAQLRDLAQPPGTLILCRWNPNWTGDAWMTILDRLSKASRLIVN